jgi:hypothetical protein
MKLTANSKPIKHTKIANGIKVNINIIALAENILYKKVLKIFNNVCPPTKFANKVLILAPRLE